MQKELEHIFVPYAIAELAKRKGYQKWCAGFQETATDNPQPNTIFAQWRFEQTPKRPIGLPTHFQLMIWLVRQFEIEVILNINGSFSVRDPTGKFIYQHDENQFDINTALVLALGIVG